MAGLRKRGSMAADLPLALWILFIGVTFPMINMAAITLRSNVLSIAAREAAGQASKASSYLTDIDGAHPSAVTIASEQVGRVVSGFSEVSVSRVSTSIVATSLADNSTVRYSAPLASPPDTAQFVYSIEVEVTGSASPLITFSGGIFGEVPGLTSPVPVTARAQAFFESPQGLTQ